MTSLLSRHWVAIGVSILIGICVIAPQLFFIYSLGSSYKGIYMEKSDAGIDYVARMEEALKGDGIGNPYIIDYRNSLPSTIYSYEETILAAPAHLIPVSVTSLSLVYKFFLPAIIALLAYALLYRLIRDRSWSIAGTILLLLGPTLVNLPDLLHLVQWQHAYGEFLLYSRPVNPELSSIVFFLYLHSLLNALETEKKRWFVILTVLYAGSFYLYFYSLTFFLALNTVFIFLTVAQKRYRFSLGLLAVQIVGLLLALPAILEFYRVYKSPYYSYLSGEAAILHSHAPVLSLAGIIAAAVLLVFLSFNKTYKYGLYLGGLLLTAFLVVNQQVVTGIVLQEGHYHWYFNTPIFIIIFIVVGHTYFARMKYGVGTIVVILICTFSLAEAYLIQSSSYDTWYASTRAEQRYAPVLSWLRENTSSDSVILADATLSQLIPAYTRDDVVWEEHAQYYLLPPARRAFTVDALLASFNLQATLAASPYRVDYFIEDSTTEPEWRLSKYSFLRKVYDDKEFQIYEK